MPVVFHTPGHANQGKVIVSLCDYSGNWPKPYADAGYTVICFDLKHGDDVLAVGGTLDTIHREVNRLSNERAVREGYLSLCDWRIVGVLMACPCTAFTNSGARWWPAKNESGETAQAVAIVRACIAIKDALKPKWWALENPAGRLPKLVPELGKPTFYFHPSDYAGYGVDEAERKANQYTKKTGLWGSFMRPPGDFRPPVMVTLKNGKRGSWMWANLGGKSERTKTLRSMTPMGFARAFASVNP